MSERKHPPATPPPCFSPKVYVCPNPDCRYIGSAADQFKTGFCWTCCEPLTDDDIHVFGPSIPIEQGSGEAGLRTAIEAEVAKLRHDGKLGEAVVPIPAGVRLHTADRLQAALDATASPPLEQGEEG